MPNVFSRIAAAYAICGQLITNAPHHPHLDNFPHHTHIGARSNRQPSYATTLEEVLSIIQSRLGTV